MILKLDNSENSNSVEELLNKYIGSIGWYHFYLVVFTLSFKVSTALHGLGIVFLAPPVEYSCKGVNETYIINQCPCEDPIYNNYTLHESMITKWNLICDKSWLVSFTQTTLMLGFLIGSIIFGIMSDKYGRKVTLFVAILIEMIFGIASSLTPDFWSYLALRFFIGCSIGGVMIVGFVVVMEFTGKAYRELITCLLQIPYTIGYLLLPLLGYFVHSWLWLNLVFTLINSGYFVLCWFIPESPRWLITAGKSEEAIEVIKTVAKVNKRSIEGLEESFSRCMETSNEENPKAKTGSLTDLLKNVSLRKRLMCASVNWAVCSFGFFGLSQYIGQLSGNIFINEGISASMVVIASVLSYFVSKACSRRATMISTNLSASFCLLLLSVIPADMWIVKVILACLGNLGMYMSFTIIYLFTAELFPTVIRNVAMGIAAMFSRLGAMGAPFIVTLGTTAIWLPPVIFGIAPIIAAILCYYLPETKNCELPNTMTEGERIDKCEITKF